MLFLWVEIFTNLSKIRCQPYKFIDFCVLIFQKCENSENLHLVKISHSTVCVCVYIYVCMYVCMYVCINMYVCMYVPVYMYMYVCMYICMYVPVCMYMYVCMYVCMYATCIITYGTLYAIIMYMIYKKVWSLADNEKSQTALFYYKATCSNDEIPYYSLVHKHIFFNSAPHLYLEMIYAIPFLKAWVFYCLNTDDVMFL